MLGQSASSKLNWSSYIAFVAKTASNNIETLIRSIKLLCPDFALYIFKSAIRPRMEYWCYAPTSYVDMLDKLQKPVRRTVAPTLAASLELLAIDGNEASLSPLYRYYFGRCSSELAAPFPLPYSRGKSTWCSNRLHDFSVIIPKCYKDVYVNGLFPDTARLWNPLPVEYFPLTFDLNCFKSAVNWHLSFLGPFQTAFLYSFRFYLLPFLVAL